MMNEHQSLIKRFSTEGRGVDWYGENCLTDKTQKALGGAFPLIINGRFNGIFMIRPLPQVEDHLLSDEVLIMMLNATVNYFE
jgi:uncharacterized protein (UPF0303 family)